MTRRAVEGASGLPDIPILQEHDSTDNVGVLLLTGDRGLAGAFNSQIVRAGNRRRPEIEDEGAKVRWYASGRRGVSSIQFRGMELAGGYTGLVLIGATKTGGTLLLLILMLGPGREVLPCSSVVLGDVPVLDHDAADLTDAG